MLSCFLLFLILLCRFNASSFDYPEAMPPPILAQVNMIMNSNIFAGEYETPIQIRILSSIDSSMWNCLAVYHQTILNSFTIQRPIVVANESVINVYGNSETRMLCGSYAYMTIRNFLMPEGAESGAQLLDTFGLNPEFAAINPDVAACDVNDVDCLQNVAALNDYAPEIMSSIVAYETIEYLKNDGWNQLGTISSDGDECTANCRPYGDTTQYVPVNDPYDGKGKRKYRWSPLAEDNRKGFFYHYDHVVPHIGLTAVPRILTRQELEANKADNPKYDYNLEKELVVERLRDLANNDTMKMLVEFFDNKVSVVENVAMAMGPIVGWNWEQRQFHITGFITTEYEAVLQSWLEKRRWDRIRPTTLIKYDEDELIETYGGPNQGLKQIKSKDFESYIRVMPHSEYPSASACICQSFTEFVKAELEGIYNIYDPLSITLNFAEGSSSYESGATPQNDLSVTFNSLEEYNDICGQSRLWGGMHFTTSIEGGRQVCANLGMNGYQKMIRLINGGALE